MNNDMVYLELYEKKLGELIQEKVTRCGLSDGILLRSDDLDEKWEQSAPMYMADAVPQIPQYPAVSLAWAAYVGMAFAAYWDKDWEHYSRIPDLYVYLREKRGFDLLDEYVLYEVVGLVPDTQEARDMEDAIREIAHVALDMLRKENVGPQSQLAFHVYARSVKVLFETGVSIEFKRLKYKYESVDLR